METKRILIVNVNWIGDVLFSTPFIRALRSNFPHGYIACMVVPRCREALEGNPHINEIIVYDEKGMHAGLFGKIKFIRRLKGYDFDTVFLLHRSFTRTLLVYLAGIPRRIGYYTAKRALFLTEKPKPAKTAMHRAKFYLGLIEAIGLKADDNGCEFFINAQDESWADGFLKASGIKEGQRIIVFNPGGNWPPKRWPAANFGMLGGKIAEHFGSRAKILISGSEKDLELAQRISRIYKDAIIACGKTTLKQSAALFKKSDLVISSDSGPLHIAVSVGAKTIALFGPTSPEITGPYKADEKKTVVLYKKNDCNIPCYNDKCENFRCMSDITPEEVFKAAVRLLNY